MPLVNPVTGNISDANAAELTGGGATTLHSHVGGTPVFPVGYVYISVDATNPATALGYGTWAAFGAGRVLVGLDAGDTDFDTVEETGGSKTVQASAQTFAGTALGTHQHAAVSAGTPAGTVSAPTFTGNASTTVVNHVHTMTNLLVRSSATGASNTIVNGIADTTATLAGPYDTDNPKAGGAASYTPTGTNSAPTFTGSALATHQHDAITAGTPAGTNTPGAATSVVQPYIVVYMFKRTA
jgi:hypothetical protein